MSYKIFTFHSFLLIMTIVNGDYWSDRERLIQREEYKTMGGSLTLTHKEKIVNDFLMDRKREEFDASFTNPTSFIPSRHIFDTLEAIEKSEVFQIIRRLPKGSSLHTHDLALTSGDFLYDLTFSDDLYVCVSKGRVIFRFTKRAIVDGDCVYRPIRSMRIINPGFDELMRKQLTLIREDYKDAYTDINVVWSNFRRTFEAVSPLLSYKPAFEAYFYQGLKELYEDNVFYTEFRTTLPALYDLDGRIYRELEVAAIYKEVNDRFVREHEDFLGSKLIYAPVRHADDETMRGYMEILKALKNKYPNFLAGFDLVAQEDLGRPLTDFVDRLLEMKNDTNFFFHAGETNWFGSAVDDNLVDAVLLGAVRIGHGYAALKRPKVLEIVKREGIAIEVCPISNQVLMLVDDLRNHPANFLIANDYPIVICNDDPAFWGTKGLSYDWYMAFMGMTSRRTDLRFLKQLAVNSIKYSVYHDKDLAYKIWQQNWDKFIDNFAKKTLDLV